MKRGWKPSGRSRRSWLTARSGLRPGSSSGSSSVYPEEQTPKFDIEDVPEYPEPEKNVKKYFYRPASGKRVDKEKGTNPKINSKNLSSMNQIARLGGIIKRKTRRRRKPRKKKSLKKRKGKSKKKRVRRKRKSRRKVSGGGSRRKVPVELDGIELIPLAPSLHHSRR